MIAALRASTQASAKATGSSTGATGLVSLLVAGGAADASHRLAHAPGSRSLDGPVLRNCHARAFRDRDREAAAVDVVLLDLEHLEEFFARHMRHQTLALAESLIARRSLTPDDAGCCALISPTAIKESMFGADVMTNWHEGSRIAWRGEWKGQPVNGIGEWIQNTAPERVGRGTSIDCYGRGIPNFSLKQE